MKFWRRRFPFPPYGYSYVARGFDVKVEKERHPVFCLPPGFGSNEVPTFPVSVRGGNFPGGVEWSRGESQRAMVDGPRSRVVRVGRTTPSSVILLRGPSNRNVNVTSSSLVAA